METLQVQKRCRCGDTACVCRWGDAAGVEALQLWRRCRWGDAAAVEALRLSLKHCGVTDKQQQIGSKPWCCYSSSA